MADSLPEISENCRCGASFTMSGDSIDLKLLHEWRKVHICLSKQEAEYPRRQGITGFGGGNMSYEPNYEQRGKIV